MAIKVLIDCDPGIDDALALLFAFGSEDLKVEFIVGSYGNVELTQVMDNLSGILGFMLEEEKPKIGRGSDAPLKKTPISARAVHGADGLGNTLSWLPKMRFDSSEGVELIIDSVLNERVDKIVATAPLTDIARAVEKEPSLLQRIDEIIIMGGAVFKEGNVTEDAEFNFYCDPDAADFVLNTPGRKILISLDITRDILVKEGMISPFQQINNDLARFIVSILSYSIEFHRRERALEGACIHDAIAVAVCSDAGIGEYEDLNLGVECGLDKTGKVIVKEDQANVRFCKRIDSGRFFEAFFSSLLDISQNYKIKKQETV